MDNSPPSDFRTPEDEQFWENFLDDRPEDVLALQKVLREQIHPDEIINRLPADFLAFVTERFCESMAKEGMELPQQSDITDIMRTWLVDLANKSANVEGVLKDTALFRGKAGTNWLHRTAGCSALTATRIAGEKLMDTINSALRQEVGNRRYLLWLVFRASRKMDFSTPSDLLGYEWQDLLTQVVMRDVIKELEKEETE